MGVPRVRRRWGRAADGGQVSPATRPHDCDQHPPRVQYHPREPRARRDVGQHQLEQAMNHWLEAGAAPLLIHSDDDSLTLVPRSSVLWIRVTDQPA